jgi:hypothetical protein
MLTAVNIIYVNLEINLSLNDHLYAEAYYRVEAIFLNEINVYVRYISQKLVSMN